MTAETFIWWSPQENRIQPNIPVHDRTTTDFDQLEGQFLGLPSDWRAEILLTGWADARGRLASKHRTPEEQMELTVAKAISRGSKRCLNMVNGVDFSAVAASWASNAGHTLSSMTILDVIELARQIAKPADRL